MSGSFISFRSSGIRYRGNDFLCDDHCAATSRAWREGLTAGRRAPDGAIAHGRDLFDLLSGYQFHVLVLSRIPLGREEIGRLTDELAGLPKSLGIELRTHVVAHSLIGRDPRIIQAESDQVFDAYGLTRDTPQAIFLIRPDGHIAYRRPDLNSHRPCELSPRAICLRRRLVVRGSFDISKL